MTSIDGILYEQALATEGFFSPVEASLLTRLVNDAGSGCRFLEVGSYRGRSTLFGLAGLAEDGELVSVDAFIDGASYRGHTAEALRLRIQDPRLRIIRGTLTTAWHALTDAPFDVALVDSDHSFAGACHDLALACLLLRPDGTLLVHDVSDLFPGVVAGVRALSSAGVLSEIEQAESLRAYRVVSRPAWLVDPGVDRGNDVPSPPATAVAPILAPRSTRQHAAASTTMMVTSDGRTQKASAARSSAMDFLLRRRAAPAMSSYGRSTAMADRSSSWLRMIRGRVQ